MPKPSYNRAPNTGKDNKFTAETPLDLSSLAIPPTPSPVLPPASPTLLNPTAVTPTHDSLRDQIAIAQRNNNLETRLDAVNKIGERLESITSITELNLALSTLRGATRDAEARVRLAAIKALAPHANEEEYRTLLAIYEDPTTNLVERAEAISILAKNLDTLQATVLSEPLNGKKLYGGLIDIVSSKDEQARIAGWSAVRDLGENCKTMFKDKKLIRALENAILCRNSQVTIAALESINDKDTYLKVICLVDYVKREKSSNRAISAAINRLEAKINRWFPGYNISISSVGILLNAEDTHNPTTGSTIATFISKLSDQKLAPADANKIAEKMLSLFTNQETPDNTKWQILNSLASVPSVCRNENLANALWGICEDKNSPFNLRLSAAHCLRTAFRYDPNMYLRLHQLTSGQSTPPGSTILKTCYDHALDIRKLVAKYTPNLPLNTQLDNKETSIPCEEVTIVRAGQSPAARPVMTPLVFYFSLPTDLNHIPHLNAAGENLDGGGPYGRYPGGTCAVKTAYKETPKSVVITEIQNLWKMSLDEVEGEKPAKASLDVCKKYLHANKALLRQVFADCKSSGFASVQLTINKDLTESNIKAFLEVAAQCGFAYSSSDSESISVFSIPKAAQIDGLKTSLLAHFLKFRHAAILSEQTTSWGPSGRINTDSMLLRLFNECKTAYHNGNGEPVVEYLVAKKMADACKAIYGDSELSKTSVERAKVYRAALRWCRSLGDCDLIVRKFEAKDPMERRHFIERLLFFDSVVDAKGGDTQEQNLQEAHNALSDFDTHNKNIRGLNYESETGRLKVDGSPLKTIRALAKQNLPVTFAAVEGYRFANGHLQDGSTSENEIEAAKQIFQFAPDEILLATSASQVSHFTAHYLEGNRTNPLPTCSYPHCDSLSYRHTGDASKDGLVLRAYSTHGGSLSEDIQRLKDTVAGLKTARASQAGNAKIASMEVVVKGPIKNGEKIEGYTLTRDTTDPSGHRFIIKDTDSITLKTKILALEVINDATSSPPSNPAEPN